MKVFEKDFNKDAYCAVVKNGVATPATSIIGPSVQYYKGNDVYAYDLEKAKSLLAEAGYPDGFKTSIMCASTTANLKQCEFLQQQLAQVGIDVEINALESAVVNQKIQDVNVPGSEAEVDRADRRLNRLRRRGNLQIHTEADAPGPQESPDGLPGSLRILKPAYVCSRYRGRAAHHPWSDKKT